MRGTTANVWTTTGVVVGVGLAGLSGRGWLDPLIAILVAVNVLREGRQLMRRSLELPGAWTVSWAHGLANAVERAVVDRTGVTLPTHV